jgi:hypothetical protein
MSLQSSASYNGLLRKCRPLSRRGLGCLTLFCRIGISCYCYWVSAWHSAERTSLSDFSSAALPLHLCLQFAAVSDVMTSHFAASAHVGFLPATAAAIPTVHLHPPAAHSPCGGISMLNTL